MKRAREAASILLEWYDVAARDLPWRVRPSGYRVWVSEIMLQQTRADVVAERYRDFLRRFPNVRALAAASLDEVLAAWSGLGYYRRARNLHAAAGRVVADFGARIPRSAELLATLPGVGAYTAAAVASIAYGEAVAAVDGNVERVVARFEALPGDPKRQPTRGSVGAFATAMVGVGRPGDVNQALMDLGATVCTPAKPRCPECPLRRRCRGRRSGSPERFPQRPRRARARAVSLACLILRCSETGRVLLCRRAAAAARLASLWELPTVACRPAQSRTSIAGALADAVDETTGLRVRSAVARAARRRGQLRHSIVDERQSIEVYEALLDAGVLEAARGGRAAGEGSTQGWRFVEARALDGLAVGSVVRKALAVVED